MKKNIGVCFGMLAMSLGVIGAPATRAQSRMAAGGTGGATETSTASASTTPVASSPADLDRRVEELEKELVELRSEMAARKDASDAAAAMPAAPEAAQDKPADMKMPDKVSIASLLGPTSLSGFVDTYYQYNYNHPLSKAANFRAFDFRSKDISLNMIELILDKAPDPMGGLEGRTGYHVSLGFGDAMNVVNSTEPGNGGPFTKGGFFSQYLKEGYFSYLAPVGKGLQVDVGKFVTPMGAEVIESKDNWNYSRGLLFTYAIPFFHFGARAKYNFNDKYNVTGFVVNGWNNIVDQNSGKTYGFSFVGNPTKKVSYTINYLAGPEGSPSGVASFDTEDFWRQMWDAVVTYNPTAKLSLMGNFDYGRGDRISADLTKPPVTWFGGAGYAKYAVTANDYVAARYEYFEDHNGFMTGEFLSAPAFASRLHFHEVTATYQHTLATHLLARLENRRDMSQFPVYEVSTFSPLGIKHQDTVSLGLIFLFDSRDMK